MNKLIALILIVQLSGIFAVAQEPPTQQTPPRPAPGKIIIQTPFGPKEVDPPAAPPQAPAPVAPVPSIAPPSTNSPTSADAQPERTEPSSQQTDPVVPLGLNMDNQDIRQVIRIILDALNINYIIDPRVTGTINIHTSSELRRSDFLQVLETILKINGATMIQTGNFYQIVPAGMAVRQPLQVQERGDSIPADDQMVLQVVRMKYVVASEMGVLLTPYLSDGGNIVVSQSGSVLLITERRSNLRKLLEVIDIFDSNAFEGERVRLFAVRNNIASNIASDLQKVFAAYAMSQASTAIRFVPIERLNSVLVVTPNASVFPEVEKWVERLDQSFSAGIRNFVYRVKNSKAADIQSILSQLYGGSPLQMSTIYNLAPGSTGAPQQQAQPPAAPTPFSAPTAPQIPQGPPPREGLKIIADSINNALVIQTTPQVYAEIEKTIQELDVLPRQVLIDAQIFEVVLDDSLSLGLTAFLQRRGTLANPQTTASFAGSPPSLAAQTFAFAGRTRELVAFLNASENRSKVRTLSAPSVLVSDNMTADFQVGAEVPIPTSSSVTPVQSGGTNLFAQTIQFRPTGVILRVKPQINDSGNVTLDISQEVSQAGANTTSGVVAPVIGKSSVNSSIVVRDGQTIALGGFIRESNDLASSRIPFIGRVPGLGLLFGNTRRASTRTELVILVTPHVLRTHEDADLATDELKAKLREIQKVLR